MMIFDNKLVVFSHEIIENCLLI